MLSYLSVVLVVLVLLEVPLGILTDHHERDLLGVQASQQATGLAVLAGEDLERGQIGDLDQLARSYRSEAGGEVLVVDSSAHAVADSDDDGTQDIVALRSAVQAGLAGRTVIGTFVDEGRPMTFAAVATRSDGPTPGAGRPPAGSLGWWCSRCRPRPP